MSQIDRRSFLRRGGAALAAAGFGPIVLSAGRGKPIVSANERIRLALIGCGTAGMTDLSAIIATEAVEVRALCDVDERKARLAAALVERTRSVRPRCERDFRRILDQEDLDAVVVATPARRRAPITSLACRAGKDVYVESPPCREIAEGLATVQTARKCRSVVQVALPLRSADHARAAVDFIRSGRLGQIGLCRLWSGRGTDQAGRRAIDLLDVVRWAMNADLPQAIESAGRTSTSRGGGVRPAASTVRFDLPGFRVVWEQLRESPKAFDGQRAAAAFYGTDATMVVGSDGWQVCREPTGEVIQDTNSLGADLTAAHVADFLDCVRSRHRPAGDIEVGVKSAAWYSVFFPPAHGRGLI